MRPRFLCLPTEIKLMILQYLDVAASLKLRLLCKAARDDVQQIWVGCFGTESFMFHEQGLQTLEDISSHPDLAGRVHTITLSLYHLLPRHELALCPPAVDNLEINIHFDAYDTHLEAQSLMVQTNSDYAFLERSLKRLPNCTRLIICDRAKPKGLKRLIEQIGIRPQRSLNLMSETSEEFVQHMVINTFAAAAVSNVPVERFDIGPGLSLGNANRIRPLMLDAFSGLSRRTHLFSTLLHLNLALGGDKRWANPCRKSTMSGLVCLLNICPSLETFTLEFQSRDESDMFATMASSLFIPNLKSFGLAAVDCTSKDLTWFLLRHSLTLNLIRFDKVNLEDGLEGRRLLTRVIRDCFSITDFSMRNCIKDFGWNYTTKEVSRLKNVNISSQDELNSMVALLEREPSDT